MRSIQGIQFQPVFTKIQGKAKKTVEEKEEPTIKKITHKKNEDVVSSEVALDILEGKNNNSNKTSENFRDVIEEMRRNVPDSTSTIEEKELAISYIDRMLACDDIPNPEYWQNKKDIIEMEIQTIKNEEKSGKDESISTVSKEWKEFTNKFWNKTPKFDNVADRVEYYRSYYNMYISFCDRVLACSDISESDKAEWTRMKQNAIQDLNYHKRDLSRYNAENNNKTENFRDVINEMRRFVPDSTSTTAEKELAISYIDRMLACDDIPNPEYWQNKKAEIEEELKGMRYNN